jgi:hypothetical protein
MTEQKEETKYCPIMSRFEKPKKCLREGCQLWVRFESEHSYCEGCAFVLMATGERKV